MVQPTATGNRDDLPHFSRLDRPLFWNVLGRIKSETEPPNLPTEKNAGCCAFDAPIPPSPVRVRESPTAKTPRNRGNFSGLYLDACGKSLQQQTRWRSK